MRLIRLIGVGIIDVVIGCQNRGGVLSRDLLSLHDLGLR